MDAPNIKIDQVTLTNVADGKLEEHFQELLTESSEIFKSFDDYESNKGNVACKLKFELDVVFNESSGAITVYARGGLTRPKRKLAVRGLIQRGDKFFVFDEPKQAPLFERKPNPEKKLAIVDKP